MWNNLSLPLPESCLLLLAVMLGGFGLSAAPVSAATFDEMALLRELVQRADEDWQGDRWHARHGDRLGGGTEMVYVALYAARTGETDRLDRVAQHFRTVHRAFWNEKERCYVNRFHYITNAEEGWCLAATLLTAHDLLEPQLRQEMESTLRDVCAYLARRTTAHDNSDDFRAMNQDALSAAAMALAAEYFDDKAIRKDALTRMQWICGRVEGPFWVEGGIDRDYQRVGEPPFAIAVNALWPELSLKEKQAAAAMAMRPFATRGLGLETSRSAGTISLDPPWGDFSGMAAWLCRVPNPLVAQGLQQMYRNDGRQVLSSPWWWRDISAACLHWTMLHHGDQLMSLPADSPTISWGGQARQMMRADEGDGIASGDFKAFIAGADGLAAMFGDIGLKNPKQLARKRNLEHPPVQFDAGGLRYIGQGHHLLTMASHDQAFPRFVVGDDVADNAPPKLLEAKTLPGFVGSQYLLRQQVSKEGEDPCTVRQQMVTLGDMMLNVLRRESGSGPVDYVWTVSTADETSLQQKAGEVHWKAPSLIESEPTVAISLRTLNEQTIGIEPGTFQPLIANEKLRVWKKHGGSDSVLPPSPLHGLRMGVRNTPGLALLSVGTADVDAKVQNHAAGRLVTLTRGEQVYLIWLLDAKAPSGRVEFSTPAGRVWFEAMSGTMATVIWLHQGEVAGFHAQAAKAGLDKTTWFESEDASRVSMRQVENHTYWRIDGAAAKLTTTDADSATDLVTGRTLPLDQPIEPTVLFY